MSTKRKASGAYTPAKKARGNTGATSKHHRCWATEESAMLGYHDNVWGRPETDTARLFESMVLQLMREENFSRDEIAELQNLIDQLDSKRKRSNP